MFADAVGFMHQVVKLCCGISAEDILREESLSEIRHLFEDIGETKEQDSKSFALKTTGYIACVCSSLFIVIGTLCAQALGGTITPFELNLSRYMSEFVMVSPFVFRANYSIIPDKKHRLWMFIAFGVLGGICASMIILVIGIITLLEGRDCSKQVALFAFLCLVGAVFVAQPQFIFKSSSPLTYNPVCGDPSDSKHATTDGVANQANEGNRSDFEIIGNMSSEHISVTLNSVPIEDELIGYGFLLGASISVSLQYRLLICVRIVNYRIVLISWSISGLLLSE